MVEASSRGKSALQNTPQEPPQQESSRQALVTLLLVAAQFVISAAIVVSARHLPGLPLLGAAGLLFSAGLFLALWSWGRIGLRRLRVMPEPHHQAVLATDGPYRFVRHPMYGGLLLIMAALVLLDFSWWRMALWVALYVVLDRKTLIEERHLTTRFPEYQTFQQRTPRLLPWPRFRRN